jgi:glycine/D-amino acid oxidase-like deaminating enzyme
MRIIINGAGIAGPTLAYWLRKAGHEVLQRSKLMTPLSDSAMATLKRCWSGVVIPLLLARDPRVFGHTLAGGEAGFPAGGGPGRMPACRINYLPVAR